MAVTVTDPDTQGLYVSAIPELRDVLISPLPSFGFIPNLALAVIGLILYAVPMFIFIIREFPNDRNNTYPCPGIPFHDCPVSP